MNQKKPKMECNSKYYAYENSWAQKYLSIFPLNSGISIENKQLTLTHSRNTNK